MPNQWGSYRLLVDDQPASILVDLGQTGPVSPYEQMAFLRLRMLKPTENGLSSQEEYDELSRVENTVTNDIARGSETLYVGRNTSSGNRDFYFYTKDGRQFEQTAAEAMAAFPNYSFTTGSRSDPEWQTYFEFLYPSPGQMEQIKNQGVLERLAEHGDELTEPREIDHFAYFPKLADGQAFIALIQRQGFTATLAPMPSDASGYSVQFSKVDRPVDMDGVTAGLLQSALTHRGTYDGWECPVIT